MEVITLAGSGEEGFKDGSLDEAQFDHPQEIAIDDNGNIFVADTGNHRIRIINMKAGEVSTLAGSIRGFKDGSLEESLFNNPIGIAIYDNGNIVVADTNNRIRLINMETGEVSTIAGSTQGFKDGSLDEAQFNFPFRIAIAKNGNIVVTDTYNHRIRIINMYSGIVSTLAGSDRGFGNLNFYLPKGIAINKNGNIVVADTNNDRISLINIVTKKVTTLAGSIYDDLSKPLSTLRSTPGFKDGSLKESQFDNPQGIAISKNGNIVVADTRNHRIRLINMETREVSTLAGSGEEGFKDGPANEAQFDHPGGIAIDGDENIFVADTRNHRIRLIKPKSGGMTKAAGRGR